MDIALATQDDLPDLARLVWLHAPPDQQARQSLEAFASDLRSWWVEHASHFAFVARAADRRAVGVAWVALVPRVPRPGDVNRCSADIQTVYVVPEHRGKLIGSALVRAASTHALRLGAGRVTVHSSSKAVAVYERLGFASSRQFLQSTAE